MIRAGAVDQRQALRRWWQAAVTVISVAAAASLGAQETGEEITGRYREPRTASYWSIIPGGGHLYSGEYERGAALLGGSVAALVAGHRAARERCTLFDEADLESNRLTVIRACERQRGWFTLSVVLASGLWLAGIADAPDSAHRANFRNGWTSAMPFDLDIAVVPDGHGAAIAGRLTLR